MKQQDLGVTVLVQLARDTYGWLERYAACEGIAPGVAVAKLLTQVAQSRSPLEARWAAETGPGSSVKLTGAPIEQLRAIQLPLGPSWPAGSAAPD
jgi:hypothetical protein